MRLNFIVSHLIEFSHVSIRSEFVTMNQTVFLFMHYFGRYSLVNSATFKKTYKKQYQQLVSFTKNTQRVPVVFAMFTLDSILGFRKFTKAGAFRFARKFFVRINNVLITGRLILFKITFCEDKKRDVPDWNSLASLQKYDPYSKSYNLIWKLEHPHALKKSRGFST